MKRLYILVVVAMLAGTVLPVTVMAATGDNPAYLTGKVYDIVNEMGIGGATVELWYLRTTIVGTDRWDPDRYEYEWILIDTCTTESRGFWMVEGLAAHPGIYMLKFATPEDALLPDGQAVTYTADNTYTWSVDAPNDRAAPLMFENPDLKPNECEAFFYNPINFNFPGLWWRWPGGDMIVNYVAETTVAPGDPCGYVETMYVYGMVYDPTLAGDPMWPDNKDDGIAGVDVQLWRAWVGHGVLSPWIGPVVGIPELIRQKPTNAEGFYLFEVAPTDTPGVEQYGYWVVVNGVGSLAFDAVACPQADRKRVEANFNWPQGVYDSLHVLP